MEKHINSRLEEYLAGELRPGEQERVREHLSRCRSCGQALEEAQSARSYLRWLVPEEAPPVPGPGFYVRVQQGIERRLEAGWFGTVVRSWRPRFAYPLLLLGLLFAAWILTFDLDSGDDSIFGFPPTQFSSYISSEADRLESRDLVMMTLVEATEED